MYPRLLIDLAKLHDNGDALCRMAASRGVPDLAFVTKCFCAMPEMVAALEDLPNRYLADSRIENLRRYPPTKKEKLLLRLPMPSQAEDVVRYADISFCSEKATLLALEAAGEKLGKTHKVVLMVDVGDLREGVFFREEEELSALVSLTEKAKHLILYGLAFNVTCYGSVIPTQRTLDDFSVILRRTEEQLGRTLEFVSAGNSSSLDLMLSGNLTGYSNLRFGEALLLGKETAHGNAVPMLHQDVLTLEAEVIEAKRKPSYPIGELGVNAFGQKVHYEDHGVQLRLIAAVGQQDVDPGGLHPLQKGLEVIGASSDHLLLTCEEHPGRGACAEVGDVLQFRPDYAAALRAFTSPYVEKVLI